MRRLHGCATALVLAVACVFSNPVASAVEGTGPSTRFVCKDGVLDNHTTWAHCYHGMGQSLRFRAVATCDDEVGDENERYGEWKPIPADGTAADYSYAACDKRANGEYDTVTGHRVDVEFYG